MRLNSGRASFSTQLSSCRYSTASRRHLGKLLVSRVSMAMPDHATLTYFDGRGHGQRIRYALASSGVKWNEVLLKEPGSMDSVRPSCTFGQVPLLEIDGLKLSQSWAIVRYLARRQGGLEAAEEALADTCAEQVRDFYEAAGFLMYGWGDVSSARTRIYQACSRFLPTFETYLVAHQRSFLVKDEPCWVDFQLLYALDYSVEVLGERVLQPYDQLDRLRKVLRSLPQMVEFYASDHNKGLVDQQYISSVQRAMS